MSSSYRVGRLDLHHDHLVTTFELSQSHLLTDTLKQRVFNSDLKYYP